jgi:hypothetical protein
MVLQRRAGALGHPAAVTQSLGSLKRAAAPQGCQASGVLLQQLQGVVRLQGGVVRARHLHAVHVHQIVC